jgi:KUP system potassium uptake protein
MRESRSGIGRADGGAGSGRSRQLALSVACLGIVYGDIGTSPLYAFSEALRAAPPGGESIFGILSLIVWSLIIVVSCKYLLLIMRADNRGEGGILALLTLVNPWRQKHGAKRIILITLGIFGAALLYGDSMITPAISVLSAVEGIETVAPATGPWIIPITTVILILLFALQSRGTAGVAALFGPIMLVWFAVLAVLGATQIWQRPDVLQALDPRFAATFLSADPEVGLVVLGAVFLVVTGAEALYADMGHFGRAPIRLAWFCYVLPCLVINYFGQGALVLEHPSDSLNPFFHMAPTWARYPVIALATAAAVIASQAVISGAFSLTRQAVQFGHLPRLRIIQTSSEEAGQVYAPFVNAALGLGTIGLVFGFKTSDNLAGAYGVAVSTTMVITTVLAFFLMRERWKWGWFWVVAITTFFIVPDFLYLAANALKIVDGGWLPLLVGAAIFTMMTTWRRGRDLLLARLARNVEPIGAFLSRLAKEPPVRVRGTGVFLTAPLPGTPPILKHHLQHNQALHEQVVLLTVVTEDVPRVTAGERMTVDTLRLGFYQVILHYGFMQMPDIPVALRLAGDFELHVDPDTTTYYLGRESIIPTTKVPGMQLWREWLFSVMSRNAAGATTYFGVPPERVVELGMQVEI